MKRDRLLRRESCSMESKVFVTESLLKVLSVHISQKKVDSRELADTILEAMDRNSAPSLDELKAIHGVSEELASSILIALELGRRKGEKRKKAITCPSDIYTAIRHDADDEQENRHGTNCVTPLFNKIWTNEEENSKLSALRDALLPKLIAGAIEISDL